MRPQPKKGRERRIYDLRLTKEGTRAELDFATRQLEKYDIVHDWVPTDQEKGRGYVSVQVVDTEGFIEAVERPH